MTSRLYITFTPRLRFEPETIAYLENSDVAIPEDGTVYYTATGFEITGEEIWDAVDTFYVALKDIFGLPRGINNLNTIFKFFYLFLGGTATTHKVNSIDPGTFNGTFSGGITHSGGGALFNGTNGTMDTNCFGGSLTYPTPPGNFSGINNSFGIYSRTNTSGTKVAMFCADGVNAEIYMYPRTGAGNLTTRNGQTGTNHNITIADSLGHISMTRGNNTEYKVYKRGVLVGTHTHASSAQFSELNIWLASIGGSIQFWDGEMCAAYGGVTMTDQQMNELDAALDGLQITLNRNV